MTGLSRIPSSSLFRPLPRMTIQIHEYEPASTSPEGVFLLIQIKKRFFGHLELGKTPPKETLTEAEQKKMQRLFESQFDMEISSGTIHKFHHTVESCLEFLSINHLVKDGKIDLAAALGHLMALHKQPDLLFENLQILLTLQNERECTKEEIQELINPHFKEAKELALKDKDSSLRIFIHDSIKENLTYDAMFTEPGSILEIIIERIRIAKPFYPLTKEDLFPLIKDHFPSVENFIQREIQSASVLLWHGSYCLRELDKSLPEFARELAKITRAIFPDESPIDADFIQTKLIREFQILTPDIDSLIKHDLHSLPTDPLCFGTGPYPAKNFVSKIHKTCTFLFQCAPPSDEEIENKILNILILKEMERAKQQPSFLYTRFMEKGDLQKGIARYGAYNLQGLENFKTKPLDILYTLIKKEFPSIKEFCHQELHQFSLIEEQGEVEIAQLMPSLWKSALSIYGEDSKGFTLDNLLIDTYFKIDLLKYRPVSFKFEKKIGRDSKDLFRILNESNSTAFTSADEVQGAICQEFIRQIKTSSQFIEEELVTMTLEVSSLTKQVYHQSLKGSLEKIQRTIFILYGEMVPLTRLQQQYSSLLKKRFESYDDFFNEELFLVLNEALFKIPKGGIGPSVIEEIVALIFPENVGRVQKEWKQKCNPEWFIKQCVTKDSINLTRNPQAVVALKTRLLSMHLLCDISSHELNHFNHMMELAVDLNVYHLATKGVIAPSPLIHFIFHLIRQESSSEMIAAFQLRKKITSPELIAFMPFYRTLLDLQSKEQLKETNPLFFFLSKTEKNVELAQKYLDQYQLKFPYAQINDNTLQVIYATLYFFKGYLEIAQLLKEIERGLSESAIPQFTPHQMQLMIQEIYLYADEPFNRMLELYLQNCELAFAWYKPPIPPETSPLDLLCEQITLEHKARDHEQIIAKIPPRKVLGEDGVRTPRDSYWNSTFHNNIIKDLMRKAKISLGEATRAYWAWKNPNKHPLFDQCQRLRTSSPLAPHIDIIWQLARERKCSHFQAKAIYMAWWFQKNEGGVQQAAIEWICLELLHKLESVEVKDVKEIFECRFAQLAFDDWIADNILFKMKHAFAEEAKAQAKQKASSSIAPS